MRLTHVKIDGYKRLRDVSVHVDQDLLAIVGANEAGKSSFLGALKLLSTRDPVPSSMRSRSGAEVPDTHYMVQATFRLSEEDLATLEYLELTTEPDRIILYRQADGGMRRNMFPAPARDLTPNIAELQQEIAALSAAIQPILSDIPDAVADGVHSLREQINVDNIQGVDWESTRLIVRSLTPYEIDTAFAARLIDEIERKVGLPDVNEAWERLSRRRPVFLDFDLASRTLKHSYDFDDLQEAEEPALRNLLGLGGVTVSELLDLRDDLSRLETKIRRANRIIREYFEQNWSQSRLSPQFKFESGGIKVLIEEQDSDSVVSISERSDGLRTFVALTAFLAAESNGRDAILLIDEAETHLHMNAQADLINILSSRVDVDQVIYTTHSPGCLPRDLGRGIRLVEASAPAQELSQVRHDFWNQGRESSASGFSPLLFAMGAGAAVFASLRTAVVTEGPTEMILLPSILRLATGESRLPYQVAPGIAQLGPESYPELRSVASNVCYLVDGDSSGRSLKKRLIEQGAPDADIFSLPRGHTVEDLLLPESYLRAVSELIERSLEVQHTGPGLRAAAKKHVQDLGLRMPGPIAVAEHLVGPHGDLQVSPAARDAIIQIHRSIMRALGQS